jgi:NADH:ubiquinone oxidoreductase subunit 6 (subunit J)
MSLIIFVFYFFQGMAAIAAVLLLFIKNIFHAALALLVCLLSVAALFAMSAAEFPAVSQILLYAGGIVVIIIFGIMLTNKAGAKPLPIKNNSVVGALVIGVGTFFLLIFFAGKSLFVLGNSLASLQTFNSIQLIGIELMTRYIVPFELTGILLLVVLTGAATVAGYKIKNS